MKFQAGEPEKTGKEKGQSEADHLGDQVGERQAREGQSLLLIKHLAVSHAGSQVPIAHSWWEMRTLLK